MGNVTTGIRCCCTEGLLGVCAAPDRVHLFEGSDGVQQQVLLPRVLHGHLGQVSIIVPPQLLGALNRQPAGEKGCRMRVCQHPRQGRQRGFAREAREARGVGNVHAPEVLLGLWRALRLLLLGQYGAIICEGLVYLSDCRVDSIGCAGL